MAVEITCAADGWRGVNCVLAIGEYDDRSRKFETQELTAAKRHEEKGENLYPVAGARNTSH